MHFLKKAGKVAAALETPPPNPHWPPAAEGLAPDPQDLFSTLLFYDEHQIRKLRIPTF